MPIAPTRPVVPPGIRLLRTGLVAGLLALALGGLAAPSVLADLAEGRAAVRAGDLTRAFQAFLAAAEAGDGEAQFLVGQMMTTGQGTRRDVPGALVWLEKAAASGHTGARMMAGTIYAFGDGVPANYPKALALLQPAAEAGDPLAQNNYAVLLYFGLGTPSDVVRALAWAMRAEQSGLVQAISFRQEVESTATPEQKQAARDLLPTLPTGRPSRTAATPTPGKPEPTPDPAPEPVPAPAPEPSRREGEAEPGPTTSEPVPGPKPVADAPAEPTTTPSARTAALTAPPPPPPEQRTAGLTSTRPTATPVTPTPVQRMDPPESPESAATVPDSPTPAPAPPPAAAARALPPPPSQAGEVWAVQVAAFPVLDAAEAQRDAITSTHAGLLAGQRVDIVAGEVKGKGLFHRILLGEFPSREAATAFCQRLKAAGQDCLTRRR